MHIPGHRVAAQVSLSHFKPVRTDWRPHCARPRARGTAATRSQSSQEPLTLFSPSKVNLFLRIIRRRPDGFHDLASLFHVIDLGDTMTFSTIPGQADSLTCDMEGVPTDASNLVIKALNLFRRHTGIDHFFQVHLEKIVPHGAGLGGGSANAATTLWAANELAGRPATNQQLLEWSGEIGSDVSIFFSNGAAYCTGRGEVVEDVEPPLPLDTPLLLVKPVVGLATPEIFKLLDLSKCSKADPKELLQQMKHAGRLTQDMCVNDLERPAFARLPELQELKAKLQNDCDNRFSAVFMTGSGSTMVGVGSSKAPLWMQERIVYQDMFCSPAKLIARQPNEWYQPIRKPSPLVAA
ncbi:MAG: 4-diphosphocytidyl-2-C-methyl-D-erythritol kinase [Trebouxia sp. A1-2]|nr:MAG: 4-diphosphocytidyl-2-C-methyl-D-erythritol kinase [Trebouxia sp. A1-2]